MSKLNEFLQAERQARKESSMVCGCLEELDTLFNSKTKSGNLAYGLYMRLLSNGLPLPSIHIYVDRVSFKFNAHVTVDIRPKYLEIVYNDPKEVVRCDTVEGLVNNTKFLESIIRDCKDQLSVTSRERLSDLVSMYIYNGRLINDGKVSMHLNPDQIDFETFAALLATIDQLYAKYPTDFTFINGLLTPVTSDSKPLTYRFYDGLVNFSMEIDNSLVKFKDYYGNLEIPQPQLLQYANVIRQLLLAALTTKVM